MKNEKRALVLSGGGSKGAYSVGVIKALLEDGRKYDVIAGVSVGALLGSFLAMQSPDKQNENFHILEDVWRGIKNDKAIYKNWAPGFLTYVWGMWKGGIYNMRPMRNILAKNVCIKSLNQTGVDFHIGAVSLQTGAYKSVHITGDMDNDKAIDWIWASTIFPILFPGVKIDGEQWVDGGVRNVIPIKDVLTAHPDVTHIDAVLTSPRNGYVPVEEKQYKSILQVAVRGAEIISDEVYASDLQGYTKETNPELTIYDPSEQVNDASFTFDGEEIAKLIDLGYNDTKYKLEKEKLIK